VEEVRLSLEQALRRSARRDGDAGRCPGDATFQAFMNDYKKSCDGPGVTLAVLFSTHLRIASDS
jgi:hypothetical protein